MKCLSVLVVILFFLFASVSSISAESLVTVSPDGRVSTNVLSLTDSFGEKDAVTTSVISNVEKIVLSMEDEGNTIALETTAKPVTFDISSYSEDVITLEAQNPDETLSVQSKEGGFDILEGPVTVHTSHTIVVDPSDSSLMIQTPTGERLLSVLPSRVLEYLYSADTLSHVKGALTLAESESGELVYIVTGAKRLSLFNMIQEEVPIEATVSATTGKIVAVDEPTWFKIYSYLFS